MTTTVFGVEDWSASNPKVCVSDVLVSSSFNAHNSCCRARRPVPLDSPRLAATLTNYSGANSLAGYFHYALWTIPYRYIQIYIISAEQLDD
jgi:hypothetical protein